MAAEVPGGTAELRSSGAMGTGAFRSAWARGTDWALTVKACADELGGLPVGANLGFLYLTDTFTKDASSILTFLREKTGIEHWVGTVGLGVLGCGIEFHDRGALSVMAMKLPAESFRVFSPVIDGTRSGGLSALSAVQDQWLGGQRPGFAVVHGDPRNVGLPEIIGALADATAPFLVGGLAASRIGEFPQIADRVMDGGVTGVLFRDDVQVVTGLSQGCSPIGSLHEITQAEGNIIREIDGRPALEVFKEDIGELLARDLRRIVGYIFAGFPMSDSDTGDYLVRNLISLDTQRGWIAVGEPVEPGRKLLFCRRDHTAAEQDLRRMLGDVKGRGGADARAGLYFSCIGRGQNLFGSESQEMKIIQDELGDIPITGFFANGEISRDRLYGYTGVLTLFR